MKSQILYFICAMVLCIACGDKASDAKYPVESHSDETEPELAEYRLDTITTTLKSSKEIEEPIEKIEEPKKEEPKPTPPVKKAPPKPKKYSQIVFEEEIFELDTITEGDVIEDKFYFENTGNGPLSISSAIGSCGCTVPTFPFIDIAPEEKGYIGVTYNSVGKSGAQIPEVTIKSNSPKSPHILKFKIYVKDKPQKDQAKKSK